jgi:hypothetical protein
LFAGSAVEVKDDEDEGAEDGGEGSEEIGVGHKEEAFEFVVLVGADGHSFSLFDEVESGLSVVDLVLVDSFF